MPAPDTEIVICSDGREISRLVLRPGEYVIGRAEDASIRVEANLVSRRHARLRIDHDDALVEDLGSSNGTFIDGQPVTGSTRIRPGQRVEVGSAIIELRRIMGSGDPDVTLPPSEAVMRRLLPEEFAGKQRYEIGQRVAQGGMGAILEARESAIERRVAMKVMLDPSQADDLVRFVAEAKVTGQLEHPNIVPVHELGVDGKGQVFYTMKFVKGITLKKVLDLMTAGTAETLAKYPLAALITIFQKACDAVAFAHSKRVIHRDLKPENIMLGDFGEVLVMDWGLAKVLAERRTSNVELPTSNQPQRSVVRTVPGASGSTQAGTIMGTPQYMAPEQARGEVDALDARADIYALGAILYHILALRPSVSGRDAMEIVGKVGRGEVEPLDSPPRHQGTRGTKGSGSLVSSCLGGSHLPDGRIPDSLAAVVRKAMALDREERYASVADLQADIAAYQGGFATSAENASLWKQGVLLVRRHKGVFTTAAAAWALITALAVWFVLNLNAERRRVEHERDRVAQEKVRAEAGERRAEQALGVANANLLRVKIEKARAAFDAGRGNEGLAWLAAVLRQDPQNSFAPAWLLSALTDRNFPIPAGPRITIPNSRNSQTEQMRAVRFSPDGRLLLIGHRVQGLSLWNPFTGQQVRLLHGSDIRDALWMPDGRRIVSVSHGYKEAVVYDAGTGKELGRTAPTHGANLTKVVSSADGSLLATGDEKGGVGVWNARTFEQVTEISALSTEIHSMDFSADNRWLALRAGTPRDAVVWDLRAGQAATPVMADINGTLRFHPTAPRLLFPAFTKMSRWRTLDLPGADEVTGLESHGSNGIEASFSPDGSRIVSAGFDTRARVWDARTGAALTPWWTHGGAVSAPQFSPEGLRCFTAAADFLCRLWDVRSGELLAEPWGMPDAPLEPNQCRLSPDGAHAALATRRRTVQMWDLRDGTQLPFAIKEQGSLYSATLSPDGAFVAGALGTKGIACIWNVQSGEKAVPDLAHPPNVTRVGFSPDGRKVFTASDVSLMIWDATTGQRLAGPMRHEKWVRAAAFSPDGRTLASAGEDKTLRLWDPATGQPKGTPIPLRHFTTERVVFSSDGAAVVAATISGALVFEVGSGAVRYEVGRDQPTTDARFSPDGRVLVVATENEGVHVVEAQTGRALFPPLGHPNRVQTVRFSADGARVATAGLDGTVRLWDARTGASLVAPMRHGSPVNGAEFSPDGERLASAGRNGMVRLWDVSTGQPISEPLRHGNEVRSIAFTPDGRRLVTSFNDKVIVWDVPPVPGPAPAWLPALAEAVAGRRIDEEGGITNEGVTDFWFSRERLLARAGSADPYEHWAAWFLADRATRTASPWTERKASDELKKASSIGDDHCNEIVLRHTPGDAVRMEAYARSLLRRTDPSPAVVSQAEYLLALAPQQVLRDELVRLRAAGLAAYTTEAGWRGFPARDPAATARQLDLTAHFNMPLDSAIAGGESGMPLGALPKGLQTFDDVLWDVRGVICLAKRNLPGNRPFPPRVERITVDQRAARLHFLHACIWLPPDGTRLGSYILRYIDGETRELPIIYGEDLRDWSASTDPATDARRARQAWRSPGANTSTRLFHRTYENPRPDVEIASLDFTSTESESAPFVVAITVE